MTKVATESLSAFRTIQAFNAQQQEKEKFAETVLRILTLARKEALASGVFFGATGWSGNVTILCLLGYGNLHHSSTLGQIAYHMVGQVAILSVTVS